MIEPEEWCTAECATCGMPIRVGFTDGEPAQVLAVCGHPKLPSDLVVDLRRNQGEYMIHDGSFSERQDKQPERPMIERRPPTHALTISVPLFISGVVEEETPEARELQDAIAQALNSILGITKLGMQGLLCGDAQVTLHTFEQPGGQSHETASP